MALPYEFISIASLTPCTFLSVTEAIFAYIQNIWDSASRLPFLYFVMLVVD
jgi:hypothetical protein